MTEKRCSCFLKRSLDHNAPEHRYPVLLATDINEYGHVAGYSSGAEWQESFPMDAKYGRAYSRRFAGR